MSDVTLSTISDKIFGDSLPSVDYLLNKYPPRVLPEGAMVTRFAPSPTGFLHIGGVFTALIAERLAHQTNGIYIVRIEDTDRKRRIDGAEEVIRDGLAYFNLKPDEGWGSEGAKPGSIDYGPYRQSERELIYKTFLKKMVLDGLAYPCFMTTEELDQMRIRQTEMKVRPGYYGVWAKWRDADLEEVLGMLADNVPFVLRFKSNGNPNNKVFFNDLVKGKMEMQENDIDAVIMKSDGLPTYHFAHVIDDFLMHPTHIIRADEWLPSTPLHLQLSDALGFKRMKYGHLSPITKIDESGNKRKISKRKDPEANIEYYQSKGYTHIAVIEYLMNLASSSFEEWRKNNKGKPYTDYRITFKALSSVSSPLFDEAKLKDISKDIIAHMSAEEFYAAILSWSEKFDESFYKKLYNQRQYWTDVFSIEREGGKRKDVAFWAEVYEQNSYFDSSTFSGAAWDDFSTALSKQEVVEIKERVSQHLDALRNQDDFMQFMRDLAKDLGLAQSIKELKDSNGSLRGHVGLVTQVIRYAITGHTNSPDLFQIITVIGLEEAKRRLAL